LTNGEYGGRSDRVVKKKFNIEVNHVVVLVRIVRAAPEVNIFYIPLLQNYGISCVPVGIGGFGFVCLRLSIGMRIRWDDATQLGITHPTQSVLQESFYFIPMLTDIVRLPSK
jgi:hypothetical protein